MKSRVNFAATEETLTMLPPEPAATCGHATYGMRRAQDAADHVDAEQVSQALFAYVRNARGAIDD